MAPKLSRTPRSLRARQNQDPGGTRKDKKLPVPGLKEHSNPQVKGGLHKTTDMEKDTRYSVPTMFTSVMRLKQRSTEKAVCDSQSNVPGVNDEQIRAFLLTSMTQGWHIDKIKLMEVSRHPTSCGIKNLYPLLLNAILDDRVLLVKKWEGQVGAKEIEDSYGERRLQWGCDRGEGQFLLGVTEEPLELWRHAHWLLASGVFFPCRRVSVDNADSLIHTERALWMSSNGLARNTTGRAGCKLSRLPTVLRYCPINQSPGSTMDSQPNWQYLSNVTNKVFQLDW
ncbi:hypothetical protein NDU88_001211 [Pleurodeles waltl]|uniref:Uncharacterized protein n=1 Tax=Pleurodeles waltl TaxID=8319 RepID=A0AAV7S9I3_PLEWA|nr:hypothetical protein NDU88_001211 [Pleurodeles waltl]